MAQQEKIDRENIQAPKQETPTFIKQFTEGSSLEALDERRVEAKLKEAREKARVTDEQETRVERERWERHRVTAAGLDFFHEQLARAFRGFYGRSQNQKALGQYEHLNTTLRIAAVLYRRDVEAIEEPTFADLEVLDVQTQELKRIASEIRDIDKDAPVWDDNSWRDTDAREGFIRREQSLCERFRCAPEEIAYSGHEITDATKVFAGWLQPGVLALLRHVEHVLLDPNDNEIIRKEVAVGELKSLKDFEHAFTKLGWTLVEFEESITSQKGEISIVKLSGAQLGQGNKPIPENYLWSYAADSGLRVCSAGEAFSVMLMLLSEQRGDINGYVPYAKDGRKYSNLLSIWPNRRIGPCFANSGPDREYWFVIPANE